MTQPENFSDTQTPPRPSSEYGGVDAGGRRPNGSVRHAGMPMGMSPLVDPSDVVLSLKLTADPTGELAPSEAAWQGLNPDRFPDKTNPRFEPNPLMDP